MNEIYDTVTNLVKDVLKENEIDNKNLELGLRKLKDKNEISPKMLATFKDVEKAKKEREKISKPEFNKIRKDGSLGEVNKSSAKELEENLDKKKIEKNVFVKEALFKSLKELFGKDMEILIGY